MANDPIRDALTNLVREAQAVADDCHRPRYARLDDAIASARAALAAPAAPMGPQHIDDEAVDRFAAALKEKLAQARAKGRSGWHECDPADLSRMLREHVEKGDPRDVANFCMFLWSLGQPISAAPAVQAAPAVPQIIDDAIFLVCARLGLAGASDEEVLRYVRTAITAQGESRGDQ